MPRELPTKEQVREAVVRNRYTLKRDQYSTDLATKTTGVAGAVLMAIDPEYPDDRVANRCLREAFGDWDVNCLYDGFVGLPRGEASRSPAYALGRALAEGL